MCVLRKTPRSVGADRAQPLQNLDTTLGHLLPAKLQEKIKMAMTKGIGAVFGKVTDKV